MAVAKLDWTMFPLYKLKRHAIAVEAHFDFVLVLTYAFPADLLRPLLSPGLTLDTFGNFGLVAVAIVHTCRMRPKGWPETISQDYLLIGYRIFVRYKTDEGRRLRGLKILRSDASKPSVVLAGNQMTHYNFRSARINFQADGRTLRVQSLPVDGLAGLNVNALLDGNDDLIPATSPFETVHEALKFAGPMPFTFDYERETDSIIRVEGVRKNWHPKTVAVEVQQMDFFNQAPFCEADPVLCSAFYVKDIPYFWKPGIVEKIVSNKVSGGAAPIAEGNDDAEGDYADQ